MANLEYQEVYFGRSRKDYYDMSKHTGDYFFNFSRDLLGDFKHFNISNNTLNYRMQGAKSPMITRELNRYFGPGPRIPDFRYYNYSPVPYFGGSDNYM